MSEVDLPAPSYTDDDYRRLHAQLVEETAKLAKLEADVRSYEITIKRIDEEAAKDAAKLAEVTRERDEARDALTEIRDAWTARARLSDEDGVQALKDIARDALKASPITTGAAGRVTGDGLIAACKAFFGEKWGFVDAEMMRAAIDAALPHMPAGRWQPIETAPKDESWFLAYFPSLYEEDSYKPCRWKERRGWQDAADSEPSDPTHWMPLPPAPSEKGGR